MVSLEEEKSEKLKAEITRMYRVRITVMEMLNDRGYVVTDSELNMTIEHFIQQHGDDFPSKIPREIRRSKRNDYTDQILVLFVGSHDTKTVRDSVKKEGVHTVIFIVRDMDDVTSVAKAECKKSGKVQVQLFKETELLVNITKHKLVPEHQLLTEYEKKALLQKYSVEQNQLPLIQVNDPVAKYMGLRRGDVVKITRPSETAGIYINYRLAI